MAPITPATSYNSTSVDYVNNAINTYSNTVATRSSARLANNMQNYQENVVNSYQHNFLPSTSMHQGAGDGHYSNAETASTSSNYAYPVVPNASPLLPSLPTPAPTPSPTPGQSPTRYMQRASVITSESNTQQNGMYAIPNVDKFLMGNDINLNMPEHPVDVSDLNSSVLLQPNIVDQFPNQDNMVKIPSIIDPATNQPIHISQQLQSQIESHLQMNADAQSQLNNSQMNSQEIYPADMLESTIGSSVCPTENLLANDVSSSIPIISGDLSMTPPLSSSIPQVDSVPSAQGTFISFVTCIYLVVV